MATGEYLGVRLADLGFTGAEDFAISATIPQIPGPRPRRPVRALRGVAERPEHPRRPDQPAASPTATACSWSTTTAAIDSDLYEVGLDEHRRRPPAHPPRAGGRYSLVVENLTKHSSSTPAIAHPAFLDGERDLYVGLFGANTQSDVRQDADDQGVRRQGLDESPLARPRRARRTPDAVRRMPMTPRRRCRDLRRRLRVDRASETSLGDARFLPRLTIADALTWPRLALLRSWPRSPVAPVRGRRGPAAAEGPVPRRPGPPPARRPRRPAHPGPGRPGDRHHVHRGPRRP